uniref:Reverse transcriptase domain-containing protein n=1 Tax=Schistocephalus solidus TaxID=70667 RepID=A0A183SMA3_SCHSO
LVPSGPIKFENLFEAVDIGMWTQVVDFPTRGSNTIEVWTGAVPQIITITLWDVTVAIRRFRQSYSPGPDGAPISIIKAGANDIFLSLLCLFWNSRPFMYADDLKVAYRYEPADRDIVLDLLKNDLEAFAQWCCTWRLSLSWHKCSVMVVGADHHFQHHQDTFHKFSVLILWKLSFILMASTDSESGAGLHAEGNIAGSAVRNRIACLEVPSGVFQYFRPMAGTVESINSKVSDMSATSEKSFIRYGSNTIAKQNEAQKLGMSGLDRKQPQQPHHPVPPDNLTPVFMGNRRQRNGLKCPMCNKCCAIDFTAKLAYVLSLYACINATDPEPFDSFGVTEPVLREAHMPRVSSG